MAIFFLDQKKTQRNMIFVFVFILIVIFIVIWRGFLYKPKTAAVREVILVPEKKINIDFKVFDHPLLKNLQPYFEIQPFERTARENEIDSVRKNPFLPY